MRLACGVHAFLNDDFGVYGAQRFLQQRVSTAINLFVQDMPRLSVDIDVVYRPWQVQREEALAAINGELTAISQRVGAGSSPAWRHSANGA